MTEHVNIIVPEDQQEGTESVIASWLKQPGEYINAHDPIVEISTDKAVVEIAAPVSGILREIHKKIDEQVEPGMVLGSIEPADHAEQSSPEKKTKISSAPVSKTPQSFSTEGLRISPAVKRLIEKHSIDPHTLTGTGHAGRITLKDIEHLLDKPKSQERKKATTNYDTSSIPSRSIPHDHMRRGIARHMVNSLLDTAPHVTATFQCDLSAVMADRKEQKESFLEKGVKLTYTSYFVQAAVAALQAVPEVNSRWHDDHLEVFEDYNIGVGTALEKKGLIVPVIQRAQDLSLFETAEKLQELTEKARQGSLTPEELGNGTFSISNHGVSGTLFATPIIIPQPQSAILGIGKLEKRPIVVEKDGSETIEIRPMMYVTLTIDHRALDAFHTNTFLTTFIERLEQWTTTSSTP